MKKNYLQSIQHFIGVFRSGQDHVTLLLVPPQQHLPFTLSLLLTYSRYHFVHWPSYHSKLIRNKNEENELTNQKNARNERKRNIMNE